MPHYTIFRNITRPRIFMSDSLKPFLLEQLRLISDDADPDVLADYILALLRHDQKPAELKQLCLSNLGDFLGGETESFVVNLFNHLRTVEPAKFGEPKREIRNPSPKRDIMSRLEPRNGRDTRDRENRDERRHEREDNSRLRARYEGDQSEDEEMDDRDHRRDSRERDYDRKRTHSDDNQGHSQTDMYNKRYRGAYGAQPIMMPFPGMPMMPGMPMPIQAFAGGPMPTQGHTIRKRGRCYAFDEKGYCPRGESCHYEHGPREFEGFDQQSAAISLTQSLPVPMTGAMPVFRGRGRGRGMARGGMMHRQIYSPTVTDNASIVVDKIPPESCNLNSVNEFFGRFGNIVNLSIQPHEGKAVIQYSSPLEAKNAHSCPDVIFNNRFVKVYFMKSESGATTPPNREFSIPAAGSMYAPVVSAAALEKQELMKKMVELQRQKQEQLQKQIEEQKSLMARLDNPTISETEKAEVLNALKAIQQQPPAQESDTELLEKLETLKKEAAEMGIALPDQASTATPSFAPTRPQFGYSARARGRGAFRGGRGGFAPGRFNLDNRTKKIHVSGSVAKEALEEHFKLFGEYTAFEQGQDQGFIIEFPNRKTAEIAMAKGKKTLSGDTLNLEWYEGTLPNQDVSME